MRRFVRLIVVPSLLALVLASWAVPAQATHNADRHNKMELLFTSPNSRINSDLAFWGKYAVHGYYRNDQSVGGFRIFDISNPAAPQQLVDFACDGLQADPILWDRNGNGIPDLLLLAVDRTMAGPQCGAARAAHDDPTGWEGVRVFTLSDNPANPFATIQQVKAIYTDCGAHTITAWPDQDEDRLLVYVSSYPLRPGPTCGQVNGPRVGRDPLHGVIQVLEVPLGNPAAAHEIAEPPITYPGDPDNRIDWCERGEGACAPGVLEPAARACHDIAVHVRLRLAAAACAEQGQVWRVDDNGIPDTAHPILISDDKVSSGGTGNIPGAVDFFHSAIFNNAGTVVNWVDESFAPTSGSDECPPTTDWAARPWHPAGTHRTGRMFFAEVASGAFLSQFQVGELRPEPGAYCSAHMGMPVQGVRKDLLVNAWYMGGVDVIDFTNPRAPKEVAFYDLAPFGPTGSDNWSAYPYQGPRFKTGPGVPVYASDGVHNPNSARGFVVFRARVGRPSATVDHLNPQTMDG
jgi:hypothetical protein